MILRLYFFFSLYVAFEKAQNPPPVFINDQVISPSAGKRVHNFNFFTQLPYSLGENESNEKIL